MSWPILGQLSLLPCMGRQMSISFSGWVIIINGDDGCGRKLPTGGLTAQVTWLGLRVDGRLCAVLQFIKWTEWTLAMTYDHDDSTINIVLVLLLLLLPITPPLGYRQCQTHIHTNHLCGATYAWVSSLDLSSSFIPMLWFLETGPNFPCLS